MHGWDDDDYDANQQKLKNLADKLSGRNRQANMAEGDKKEVSEHPAIAK